MKNMSSKIIILMITMITLGFIPSAEAACTGGTIDLTAPIGGETWAGTQTITWTNSLTGCATGEMINLVLNDGGLPHAISAFAINVPVTDLSHTFDTTGVLYGPSIDDDDDYQIQIYVVGQPTQFNDISNEFTIDNSEPGLVTNLDATPHTPSVWSTDNNIVLNWTDAVDVGDAGLDGYSVVCDTTPGTLPTTTKNLEDNVETDTCIVADGNAHYFHIRSVDNAGNWDGEAAHIGPFYVDTVDPTTDSVVITNLDYNAISNYYFANAGDVISFEVGASDTLSGVASVTANLNFIDGTWSTAELMIYNASNSKWELTTSPISGTVADNLYTVPINVTDNAGLSDTSNFPAVVIDNTAPTVALAYADGDVSDGDAGNSEQVVNDSDTLTITATFTEATAGIDEVNVPEISIDCSDNIITYVPMTKTNNLVWYYDYNVPATALELCNITIDAQDRASNTLTDTTTDAITVDNTLPIIDTIAVSPDYYKIGDTVYIGFNITEDNLFQIGLVTIGGKTMTDTGSTSCLSGTYDYCYSRTLDGFETEGSAVVSITVDDLAGNSITDTSETINTDFTVPATLVINAPADSIINADQIVLTLGTPSSDTNWDTYQVKYDTVATCNGTSLWTNTADTINFIFDLTGYQNADNYLCIRGKDLAANVGNFDQVRIIEDSQDPNAVTGLSAIDTTGATRTITVTWTDTTDVGLAGIEQYNLYGWKDSAFTDVSTACHFGIAAPGLESFDANSICGSPLEDYETYYFAVVAVDKADNQITNTGEGLVTVSAISYPDETVSLDIGWNMFSTPLLLDDENIVNVLAGIDSNVEIVWYYDPVAVDWLWYKPTDINSDLLTFEDGNGYWIDMDTADDIIFSGTYLAKPGELPPTYTLTDGWNMVGYTKMGLSSTATRSQYFAGISDELANAYAYDGTSTYLNIGTSSAMIDGAGYWVLVTDDVQYGPGAA